MSGWEQMHFNEMQRWHAEAEEQERRLQKMERDVERGKKILAELEAEKAHVSHGTRVSEEFRRKAEV
jgi:hypothetical protein